MIKIIHGSMEITRMKNDIRSVSPLNDSIHIKFNDNTELIMMVNMTPERKAILSKLEFISSDNFIINLNNHDEILKITG